MNKIKSFIMKRGSKIASLSLAVAVMPIVCRYFVHQPSEPVELLKYKK